ncbi:putative amidohydrolase [Sinobacterium caligoides]|uniref:Putative amidohydrolase n=1 Tax=Sinobacterium caligoides TaxID=933926 RepID=A0A3N2DJI1_9GAMM|nr:carbon-nitrogen hydrolase family protein [Sinobacterium caligoides]ROR99946.1 putative amidohydrolase [Sinobacterium caligoides]
MSQFAIAGLQLALKNQDNSFIVASEIEKAKQRFPWLNMVVVGELACFGPNPANALPVPNKTEAMFCELAKKHGIWIIPGSMFELDDGKVYNTMPVISPDGEVVCRYRKIYPFYPYEAGVETGSEFVVFDVPNIGRFGLSICYDMWFPETTRELVSLGAEVIIHPTMTNTLDRDLELSIARTNAAVNQCYFFDVNCAGDLGNGLSTVVSPEGRVLHTAGENSEVIAVEIDLSTVRRTRERGLMGLGQPLKSFRDNTIEYSVYSHQQGTFDELGPLDLPTSK